MNPANLDLDDIIIPEGIDFWPLAPAWYILLVLCVLSVFLFMNFYKKYKKKWTYRKQALALLKQSFQSRQTSGDSACNQALVKILKQTAISAYLDHKEKISSLQGKAWVNFLNKQSRKPVFDQEMGAFLALGIYQQNSEIDVERFYRLCAQWIKQHEQSIQGAW